jgi:hypothetical protein
MHPLGDPPELNTHPVDVGQRTEAVILSELVRRGYRVLLPFGVNQRYDLVLDLDGQFMRVQCKTGRLRDGGVFFATQSTRSNTRKAVSRGYLGDADLFLVHCPQNGCTYAVPVKDAVTGKMFLRVTPPANGQAKGVRWAKNYELPA